MMKTGEGRVDDVERGGHGVGNGVDRGCVGGWGWGWGWGCVSGFKSFVNGDFVLF